MPSNTEVRLAALEEKLRDVNSVVKGLKVTELMQEGAGDPNGVVTAVQGTFYWDSTNQILYVNVSIAGTPPEGTLWAAIASSSGNIGWSRIEIDNGDSPYTAAVYTVISCDTDAGNITVNLPAIAAIYNRLYDILNNGTGQVTVDGNGAETIAGNATQVLNQYEALLIQAGTTEWDVL